MLVHSTFLSLDGEVNRYGQGRPSFFIRLAGCNLRCPWCDIPEAQDSARGVAMTIEELCNKVLALGSPKVTITGGEPLLQGQELNKLLWLFFRSGGIRATIETNGTISPRSLSGHGGHPMFPFGFHFNFVMDYKLHDEDAMDPDAFLCLSPEDWVKIVVADEAQYQRARQVMDALKHDGCQASFALSPVHDQLYPRALAGWMLRDHLWDVNLNVQLHRIIGLP